MGKLFSLPNIENIENKNMPKSIKKSIKPKKSRTLKAKPHVKTLKAWKRGGKKLQKMNCNPSVEGKTVNESSCFTKEVLLQISKAFNKHHKENPVKLVEPPALWKELKTRMANCDKEDCWLQQIDDAKLRQHIDEIIFAPDQPPEWTANPNEWLSNYDIIKVLSQYEKKYPEFKIIGPTPIDFDTRIPEENGKCVWEELCRFSVKNELDKGIEKIGVVFNLDKHDESGSHWVSLYIDMVDCVVFYFDSVGNPIPSEIRALVDRILQQGPSCGKEFEFYENTKVEHQTGGTECGVYSLFFIITMLTGKAERGKAERGKAERGKAERGKAEKTILHTMKDKVTFFTTKRIPDKYIEKYRNRFFNIPA
jgi:hypothetical protein